LKTAVFHGLSQELPFGINKTGAKAVVTMHDAIFMRYPELYDSFYRKIFIKKNEYSCQVADKIIAISQQTKQDFIDYFNVPQEKITVVYQGCDNIFREKITESQKTRVLEKYHLPKEYILNVGAIEKRKNIATIIEALHRNKINLPLVVIGNKTAYLKEVVALINKYKLEKQVLFLHHIETKDLPVIYNMAQLFIYPSIFEGFGIPILEALCTGTPVISSKGSCFEETGGPNSCYVDYNNPDEMGEQIDAILSDGARSEKMRINGLKHAEKFKNEHIAKNLMAVYQSLL
jgi:glycosyltransferase involved in cell wall biosynthesis